jgi:formylglycine-generating enzyme required for sulfatase activity
MKRHALFVALLCLSSLLIAASKLNALTIPASEDSYTAPGNKLSLATNNANSLVVDASRKSYLYFDLSDVPTDAVVRWAKLRLFLPIVQRPGAGLSVHLVTSEWNESKAATSLPTLASGTIGVITPDKMASRRFVTVDVTSTVQNWIKSGTINGGTMNEGFAVQPIVKAGSPTASVMLTSKEGPVFGLPAELDIEFQPEAVAEKPVKLEQLPSEIRDLLNPPPVVLQTFDQLPSTLRSYLSPKISTPTGSNWSLNLSVEAQGVGALTYQWMRDGVVIAGMTGPQLPTQGLQSGTYTVVVSNEFASVTSGSLQLSVPPMTPSPSGTFALVTGGTLPASSPLGAVPVDTFYIGKTEVTWGEWQTVRTWAVANGYTDLDGVGQGVGDNYPVTHVNWYDVVKWCNARSEKEGKVPVYKNGTAVYRTGEVSEPAVVASANGYRLPSEKEWEFAARGGTQTNGYTYSGSNDTDAAGWHNGNSGDAVHEVGRRQANELGIYDMSGNVWELTGSWYFNFQGFSYRVIRGGGWDDGSAYFQVVGTPGYGPLYRGRNAADGFRVATSGEYALGITAQPSVSFDGTKLSVEAAGAGTLTYQWKLNGGAIAGGTNSQLSTQGLQSGTYTVVIGNGLASVTSESIQYTSPIGTFSLVTSGTLPASSTSPATLVPTFYIGRTEITWKEWNAVRSWALVNGYSLSNMPRGVGENFPVQAVTWFDAVKWCNAKSEMEGLVPVYQINGAIYKIDSQHFNGLPLAEPSSNGYRLPTTSEWDWAAIGGSGSKGYKYSGSDVLNDVAWTYENSGLSSDLSINMKEVGTKTPNELGVYDMNGNVWEWCWDIVDSGKGSNWAQFAQPLAGRIYGVDRGSQYTSFGLRIARNAQQ